MNDDPKPKYTTIKKNGNYPPIIKVHLCDRIDGGSFSEVYRISRTRIVKVFTDSIDAASDFIIDEIKGMAKYENPLPVLDVVAVDIVDRKWESFAYPQRTKRYVPLFLGIIKRYLPREAYEWDIAGIKSCWDHRWDNYRKDSKGNVYRIDTQTRKCISIVEKWGLHI